MFAVQFEGVVVRLTIVARAGGGRPKESRPVGKLKGSKKPAIDRSDPYPRVLNGHQQSGANSTTNRGLRRPREHVPATARPFPTNQEQAKVVV